MATVFKTFLNDDVVTARTLLHEAIPVSGALAARTYEGPHDAESNIKNYPHGMFQSVYDYPYMSSSANHIFDLTVGIHASSDNYDPTPAGDDSWAKKKKNIYNQMAQVLVGHDTNGDIKPFDQDGDFTTTEDDKYLDALFINVARLIGKDEIRKGSFSMKVGIGEYAGQFGPSSAKTAGVTSGNNFKADSGMPFEIEDTKTEPRTYIKIEDLGAATDYRVNSPAGEYGILKMTEMSYWNGASNAYESKLFTNDTLLEEYEIDGGTDKPDAIRVGLIYYQAGVIVLDPKIFLKGTAQNGFTQVPVFSSGAWSGGWLPHDISGANNPTASTAGTTDDGNPDWLKDDRGEVVLQANYNNGPLEPATDWDNLAQFDDVAYINITNALKSSTSSIERVCNGLRNRIFEMKFNNTTELNSTIYFCRVNHNDFNYSSNPTYLGENDPETGLSTGNNSKIRVKQTTLDAPVSYITTIGLYSADNELLAVAKLSEPLKKDPQNEMILRVRLDY